MTPRHRPPADARPAEELRTALRALADPVRAEQQRAYLRSDLHHLGATVPEVRHCVTRTRRALGPLPGGDVLGLAQDLWAAPRPGRPAVFEDRRAAVEVLLRYAGQLDAAQLAGVEELLRECRAWALVDPLAVHWAGAVAARDPDAGTVLDRWIADPDL